MILPLNKTLAVIALFISGQMYIIGTVPVLATFPVVGRHGVFYPLLSENTQWSEWEWIWIDE